MMGVYCGAPLLLLDKMRVVPEKLRSEGKRQSSLADISYPGQPSRLALCTKLEWRRALVHDLARVVRRARRETLGNIVSSFCTTLWISREIKSES